MDKEVVISVKTVLWTLLILAGGYVLYQMQPVILTFFVAFLVVIAMEHPIQHISKIKVMNSPIGRSTATIMAYFIFVVTIIVAVTIIIPPVILQLQKLFLNLSAFAQNIPGIEGIEARDIVNNIANITGNFYATTSNVFSALTTAFTLLIICIYMSMDWPNIKKRTFGLFNGDTKEDVMNIANEIEASLGHWIKGQLYLMLAVGLMSFVGLIILDMDNALALSLLAGLLEIVPLLGPLLSAVIAGIVGFSDSATKGILVIALFTLIQQLENNILVPKIMQKVSGFSPLSIILALLVGTTLLGTVGAVIAVPTMMIGVILFKHLIKYRK